MASFDYIRDMPTLRIVITENCELCEKDGIVERKIEYQEGNLVVGERVSTEVKTNC